MAPGTTSKRTPEDSTPGADARRAMESELSSPALTMITPPPRERAAVTPRVSKSKSMISGEEESKQSDMRTPKTSNDDVNTDVDTVFSTPTINNAKKDVDTLVSQIYVARGDPGVQQHVKKEINALVLKMDGPDQHDLISYIHKCYEAVNKYCEIQGMGDVSSKGAKPKYHEKDIMGQIAAWTLPADVSEATSTSYAIFTQLVVILLSSLTQLEHAASYVEFYRQPSKVDMKMLPECQRVLNGVCARLVTVWSAKSEYQSILKAYATRLTSASGAREVDTSSRLHVLSAVLRSHGQADISEAITLSDAMTFLASFLHEDTSLLAIRDDHVPRLLAHLTIIFNSLGAKACEMMARAHFGTNARALPTGNHIIDAFRDSCLTGSERASESFDLEAFGKELQSVLSRAARLSTIPKKTQANTATAEDAFFSAEEKRSAELHAMITKLAAFFVDAKSSAGAQGTKWPRPGATKPGNSNNVKRYPVPDGFPSGICYKYCIGVCHREHCNRKHEKTDEAMRLIRDAATTKEN